MHTYLVYFLATTLFVISITIPAFLFLSENGEYLSSKEIYEKQTREEDVIFESAFRSGSDYKLYALRELRPKVISLGSSRVMQFRRKSFSKSFLNLGGVMNSIAEGNNIADQIIASDTEIIILGIDVWWFNKNWSGSLPNMARASPIKPYQAQPNLTDIPKLFTYLLAGKVKFYSNNHIGLAGKKGDGYGNDGFRHYGSTITGDDIIDDINFKDTIDRINRGRSRFQYGTKADKNAINDLIKLINKFKSRGISVIIFIPPFAREVSEKINSMGDAYNYINDLKSVLGENGIEFIDYSRVDVIGSSDCEFIDGFHGGEISYARILKDMYYNHALLHDSLNIRYIDRLISENDGMATSTTSFPNGLHEVDFLKLGCDKRR